jgi:hypothetical protein
MAANTSPIFSGTGDIQWASTPLVAANTNFDGTGANSVIVATAGASGSFIQRIRFRASGSATATVARIFLNNGQSTGSAVNNILFDEITLAATTVGAFHTYQDAVNLTYQGNIICTSTSCTFKRNSQGTNITSTYTGLFSSTGAIYTMYLNFFFL